MTAENLEQHKAKLEEHVQEPFPPVWEPETAEMRYFEVLAVRNPTTRVGSGHVAELLDLERGSRCSVWLSEILHAKRLEQHVRVGDWIGLCYHGIRTSAQGRGYYLWSLVVSEERRRELEEQDRSEPEADEELIEVDLRAELESLKGKFEGPGS